jgi:hypothetical protein
MPVLQVGTGRMPVLRAGRAGISGGLNIIAIVGTPGYILDGPIQQPRQAAVGFEPTNNGFANRRLSPLGYAADSRDTFSVHLFCEFCKEIWSEFFGWYVSGFFCKDLRAASV